MKNIILTTLLVMVATFSTEAQTSQEIYTVAPKNVQIKIDDNKKNGEDSLKGITAQHIFKGQGPVKYTIADLDVHLIEAPGMIDYAINLNTSWSKIRSLEFQCDATFTLDKIKSYLEEVGVTIIKDKVTYTVQ